VSRNAEVARVLEEFADRLDATGVDYKPRAYRRAAENVRDHPGAVEDLAVDGPEAVAAIDGVGDAIASKIVEYLDTGTVDELEALREETPSDIAALTRVEGVGPMRAGALHDALGIDTLDDLAAAAEAGGISDVEGFGPKTEAAIRDSVDFARQAAERTPLGEARPLAAAVVDRLRAAGVERAVPAGSIRRWRPTVGDVDVLATVPTDDTATASVSPADPIAALVEWDRADPIESGETKASVRVDGVRVDLRVVAPDAFGAALQYFTGSKAHNVALRSRAADRGLLLNEYGVFRPPDGASAEDLGTEAVRETGDRIAGETEASTYGALDLPTIPPELREDRGEIGAAASGDLPDLVDRGDVRGDLHTHTEWSDGALSIRDWIDAAAAFGHDYVAVTDHATGPGMVGGVGLDDEELLEQAAEVREVASDADVALFAGVEANIDAEGGLSVGDDALDELDCVVASPHAALDGDGTDRVVAAIEHPATDIVGHPTGRQLNRRSGLDLDFETVGKAAAEHGVALEINANPRRLDLRGAAVKQAVEQGATVAVDTDAHRPESYAYIRYGVHTARRGWAEPADVLNTQPVGGVRRFLGI
jgi:DNA polymerase (family 10)